MGYRVYERNERNGRDCGYGVPSICDHPDCTEEIDRGLSYICGSDVDSEHGCGLYFCDEHLHYAGRRASNGEVETVQLCECCLTRRKKSFTPKPDTAEWIEHKATDPSWAEWREEQAGSSRQVRSQSTKEAKAK